MTMDRQPIPQRLASEGLLPLCLMLRGVMLAKVTCGQLLHKSLPELFQSLTEMCGNVLQNDKRQLETAMVVESRLQMKQKGLSKRSLGDTEDSYLASEVSIAQSTMQRHWSNLASCPTFHTRDDRKALAGPALPLLSFSTHP